MQNNSPVDNFWAEMHLDGAQVDQLLCKPGEAKIFEGFKEGGKISEFLFALPRFQRATDGDEVIAKDDASGKSRLSQLGSLTIRTFPAEYKHDEDGVLREFGEFRQERFCCFCDSLSLGDFQVGLPKRSPPGGGEMVSEQAS